MVIKKMLVPVVMLALASCMRNSADSEHSAKEFPEQIIDSTDMTNNFYDNSETFRLNTGDLIIDGEISNPGTVDFSGLAKHSLIVKETLLEGVDTDRFEGAYRYDGYSLFDILDGRVLNKLNSGEFNPIIDVYIEVENDKGQKVVFSWGEIFYPNNLHKIIIATSVSRIVPSKTRDLWPLPGESKIVAGNDLITERNISSPVRISVRSYKKSFALSRELSPLYSPAFKIFRSDTLMTEISAISGDLMKITYNTIFYGRGRGIHSTQPFSGVLLKDLLREFYPVNRENLQRGIIGIAGKDGYRCVLSFSELFNRNDQQEFMMVQTGTGDDGGLFRMFPAPDFFSDRAIKSVNEIRLDR